jgi:hypothetical protein
MPFPADGGLAKLIFLLSLIKIRVCRTIILPVVLYEFETCSLTLRKECRLKVFDSGAEKNIWTEER